VEPRTPCRLFLQSVSSTAPERVDVQLQQTGHRCRGPRRTEHFVLPLPIVWLPGQAAHVRLPDRVLILKWKKPPLRTAV
jgi:hypothetical protein